MIYVIRHGRTDWNEDGRLQGGTDIPLNETGRKQAEEARKKYGDIHFDAVFCSPLIRAKETAEIFLKGRNLEITYDDRLKEMHFGEYEGTYPSERPADCAAEILFSDPPSYIADRGAESLESLYGRTGEFLEEVALPLHEAGKTVLIVGHGAMNRSIITRLKGLPVQEMWDADYRNCQLIKVL